MRCKFFVSYTESNKELSIEVLTPKSSKFNYLIIYNTCTCPAKNFFIEEVYKVPAEINLNSVILASAESSINNITIEDKLTTITLSHLEKAVKYIKNNHKNYIVKNKSLINKVYNAY